ncbi:MAG: helix-hairpin-helix domain-containing protein [Candidatus Scalindua sediminis]|nr:helix-hairpin-helix domain-containing protein [Candidatus Scalindua sediminis]
MKRQHNKANSADAKERRSSPVTLDPFLQYRINMRRLIKFLITFLLLTEVLIFGGIFQSYAAELQRLSNARLMNNPSNDGDSFFVEVDGKPLHVRLYFVDCPETSVNSKSDARRVREQTRYFGLSHAERTIHFGNEAANFVERLFSETTFTVHTAFASALGRSAKGRVYAFITTVDGKDLAILLIENGLARNHGFRRKTPNGIPRDEMLESLRDLETSAMLKRVGIWSESDPDRIAELRAEQRREDRELQELQKRVEKAEAPQGFLDLNTATEKELQTIKGIGPVLAARIIAGRPYKTVDDLLKVKGIGPKKLEKIRLYFVIGKE